MAAQCLHIEYNQKGYTTYAVSCASRGVRSNGLHTSFIRKVPKSGESR